MQPIRKIKIGRKWHTIDLYPPAPSTVLSKNFDYQTYIEELIQEQTTSVPIEFDQELADLFAKSVNEDKSQKPIIEKQTAKKRNALNKAYNEAMVKLQCLYEKTIDDNWQTDIHINKLMQDLAEQYLTARSVIDQNHEAKHQNQSILIDKIDTYDGINRLVADAKQQRLETEGKAEEQRQKQQQLQQESIERIRAYREGKITPADLLGYDIRNLGEVKEEAKLRRSARIVINGLYNKKIDLPNYEEYTMRQLYSIYKTAEPNSKQTPKKQGKAR